LRVCKLKNSSIKIQIAKRIFNITSCLCPEEWKTEQTEEFYETLHEQIHKISKNDYIVVAGDYNARVGNIATDGTLGTNGEITTNSNGYKLKEFASVNELKITNKVFEKKKFIK